jgi:DNA mismatch repair ATPase MutS
MTHAELQDFYEKRKVSFSGALETITRKINLISNLRLLTGLVFAAGVYLAFSNPLLLYLLPLVLLLFILLVRRHATLFDKRTHLQTLKQIQEHELSALRGYFTSYSSGSEFIDPHHPYTHDLDIFGEGSVYQYLNRTSTPRAKKLLASRLSAKSLTLKEITDRQEAAKELALKNDFRQEIQALGMQADESPEDHHQLLQWLEEPFLLLHKRGYRFSLTFFPTVTIALVLAAFLLDGFTTFAVMAAGLQWVFLGFHRKRVNAFHQYVGGKKNALEKFSAILFFMRGEKYSCFLMQSLGEQAQEADEKVRELASLVRAFDARLNNMTSFVLNSLLLYDLQCVYRLERWKAENATRLQGWLHVVAETEVLCGMGTFSFNHDLFVFPQINSVQKLQAEGMGHPLIRERERVTNDVHLDEEHSVMIITGANMAGKSTFLRSLGVNVVLALAGAPVCAAEFECPLIDIRSGMRTADSLRDHQSYFYAELDRLRSIMDELRQGTPLLILLDEILKGTNSTDKQAGSVALVKQLVDHSCFALIATHDLSLGALEEDYPGRILNYSFEATIENEQLSFDYKLKRGLAQKMNATFLMRKMGIII